MKQPIPLLLSGLLAIAGAANAGTLFFGAYPNSVLVFDEATAKVTDRIMLDTGLPTSIRLSADAKKIYVSTNDRTGIEVIDIATKKVTNKLTLNTATKRYRINGGVPDPTERYYYAVGTEMTKQADRYEVGRPKYMVIDLQNKRILKTYDMPPADETPMMNGGGGRGANMQVSPDGKYLYAFQAAIVVLDTSDFHEVERLELSKPDLPGLENVGFGPPLDSIAERGMYVSVYNAEDPIVHNRIFGIGRLDLSTRKMEFTPVGPAPAAMSGVQISPDKKTGYVVSTQGVLGNKRCEIWSFDLANNRLKQTQEVNCRSRFSFGMSSTGQKLYIYGAGFEFDVYNATSLKFEKTWDAQNDITMAGLIAIQ